MRFNTRKGKPKPVTLKVLLDSGASESVVLKKCTTKLCTKKAKTSFTWSTPGGGKFLSNEQTSKGMFTLPELHDDKIVEWDWHVTSDLGAYDAIMGRDLMEFLGIDIRFSTQTVEWDHAEMPFNSGGATVEEAYHIDEPEVVTNASDRLKKILDAKCEAADLRQICEEQEELEDDEKE